MAQLQPLTADQILSQFEELIADSLDQVTELFILNEVKDTLETDRAWAKLKRLNKSNTSNPGDTFQTQHTLPDDFGMPSQRGIYVGTDLIPYKQIPFEAQIDFQAITYAYFVDLYSSTFSLCGSVSKQGTINFFYQATSPALDLVTNGGFPWIFPARFHPILPYLMAIKYFAIDQGDKAKAWDDRWVGWAREIREGMNSWDDSQQMQALQNEYNIFTDPASFPTIVDMDQGPGGGGVMFG